MAIYQFMCDEHGGIEREAVIGTAPPTLSCPDCGQQARRVFSAPMLSRLSRAMTTAFENAERSGDEPDVVTSVPSRTGRPAQQRYTHNPTHRRLPKL
ncbi:MAG: hypothetical protein M0026_07960 [Nocardiopsaceae bacterium]|nr:hypothetical protein [Nocardiopsaceae bacterium]